MLGGMFGYAQTAGRVLNGQDKGRVKRGRGMWEWKREGGRRREGEGRWMGREGMYGKKDRMEE